MRSSSIIEVPNDPMSILRKSYIDICNNSKPAAYLLNYFIYWHDIKIRMSEKNKSSNDNAERQGQERSQDETLLQFHTSIEIYNQLLGSVGRTSIEDGIKLLVTLNFLSIHRNPSKRLQFDNTRFFLVNTNEINSKLMTLHNMQSPVCINSKQALHNVQNDHTENVKRSYIKGKNNNKDYSIDYNKDLKEKETKEKNATKKHSFKIPYNLNIEAWNEFVDHRNSGKKKISELAKIKNANLIKDFTHEEQQLIIDHSIRGDYTGLFPDSINKIKSKTPKLTPYQEVVKAQEDRDFLNVKHPMKDINPIPKPRISDEYFN